MRLLLPLLALLAMGSAYTYQCDRNEDPPSYPSCTACEATCENPVKVCSQACAPCPHNSDGGCPTKCQCKPEFVRHGGKCIRSTECPRSTPILTCPANEDFFSCTACEATCEERTPVCRSICTACAQGQCPTRCQCYNGFVRHAGKCISPLTCPRS